MADTIPARPSFRARLALMAPLARRVALPVPKQMHDGAVPRDNHLVGEVFDVGRRRLVVAPHLAVRGQRAGVFVDEVTVIRRSVSDSDLSGFEGGLLSKGCTV